LSLPVLDASLVVVSDIHLNHPEDERARILLALLATIETSSVDTFCMLGDIFDFCLGSHTYFQKKYAPIGDALERVAASGTRVIYLEGNHEFRLNDLPWRGIEFVAGGTKIIPLANGQSVQAAHGDMIYSHRRYKAFRYAVKSRFVTGVATLFPGSFLDRLTSKTSEVSRSADAYRPIYHEKILDAVDSWMESRVGQAEEGSHYGIFGHFHVPYAEPRRDLKEGAVLSVDSWDKPNALIFAREGICRLWLPDANAESWRVEPVTPLVRGALMRPGYPEIRA
jgi:UDP-2,3-diacylglucosamine hydrolase